MKASDIEVTACGDCPAMHLDACSIALRGLPPGILSSERTAPTWCPLRKDLVTIRLKAAANDVRANPLGPMPQPEHGEPHDVYLMRLADEFWARGGDAVRALGGEGKCCSQCDGLLLAEDDISECPFCDEILHDDCNMDHQNGCNAS